MSVAVVVYSNNGIVMATDGRIIGNRENKRGIESFVLSDNFEKTFILKDTAVGVSACRNLFIRGKNVQDFLNDFALDRIVIGDTVNDVIEKLCDYCKDYADQNIQFLIAGYEGGKIFIYSLWTDGENVKAEAKNILDGKLRMVNGIVWSGCTDAIERLIIGKEEPVIINFNYMSLQETINLAKFLVETQIRYDYFKEGLGYTGGKVSCSVIEKSGVGYVARYV